jgi:anti-anti-sigma factor
MGVSPPQPGYSRADLHVHTTYSDGTATPEDVLNYYALRAECRLFAITDHDTLDGALHARDFAAQHPDLYGDLELIIGEEVSSRDGHVLGVFLEESIPPGLDAAETIAAIHAQGGLAIAAHPYTSWMRWAGLVGVGDLIRELPFDAVETRNANFTEVFANRKAERNAGQNARVGNSDGHFLEAIGRCYTDFPGSGGADLKRAIRERTTVPGGRCYGLITLARYVVGRVRSGGSIVPRRRQVQRNSASVELDVAVNCDAVSGTTILTLTGSLDARSMPELKETVNQLGEERMSLVLDLSGLSRLESAGVAALVAGAKCASRYGIGFCLAAVPTHGVRALRAAGLERKLLQSLTVEKACELVESQVERRAHAVT